MTTESRPNTPIRVMVVDDHDVVRTGLRALLSDEEGIVFAGEASNSEDAVARAPAFRPDVVLMDVRMGPNDAEDGIEACREIRSELPDTAVLMFSSFGERESVMAAVLAGASGFLTKNVPHRRLLEGIRTVAAGGSMLDSAVTGDILRDLRTLAQATHEAGPHLSDRESDVLQLIGQGLTNKEIGLRLGISPITARNHVSKVLEKLNVANRTEAALLAEREGLLNEPSTGHSPSPP